MSTPPTVPDHAAQQLFPPDPEGLRTPIQNPNMVEVGDEGKAGIRPDQLGRDWLAVGGPQIGIQEHVQAGTTPTLVPPEASREKISFSDLLAQKKGKGVEGSEGKKTESSPGGVTTGEVGEVSETGFQGMSGTGEGASTTGGSGFYSTEGGMSFGQVLQANTNTQFNNAIGTLNGQTADFVRVAMAFNALGAEGMEEVEDLSNVRVAGEPIAETEEEAEEIVQKFTTLDAKAQGEYRYTGSFMAAMAKALALVSLIKGLMSTAEHEEIREQQGRDIEDLKAEMNNALKEIEKREKMRDKLEKAKKKGGFLGRLPGWAKIIFGIALMIAAILAATVLFMVLGPVAALILAAAFACAGFCMFMDGCGISLEQEVGKMACAMFGGDQEDALFAGHMIGVVLAVIVCVLTLGLATPLVVAVMLHHISEAAEAKSESNYQKEKDEIEADRLAAGAGIAGMKAGVSQQMAAILAIAKMFGDEAVDEEKSAFMIAMIAILAMLMALMAAMHGGGAAGNPAGGKATGAGAEATATEGGVGGAEDMGAPGGEGMGMTAEGGAATTTASTTTSGTTSTAGGEAAGARTTTEAVAQQDVKATETGAEGGVEGEQPFGTGQGTINGQPTPDLSTCKHNHPALDGYGTFMPGGGNIVDMDASIEGDISLEAKLEQIHTAIDKIAEFMTAYREDPDNPELHNGEAILAPFVDFTESIESVMNNAYGVGDPDNEINEIIYNAIMDAIAVIDPSYADPGQQSALYGALEAMMIQMNKELQSTWATVEKSETEQTEEALTVAASA